jgi:P-type E1-E2 ATPase
VLAGVTERLQELSARVQVHLLSANTRGLAAETAARLCVRLGLVTPGEERQQKAQYVEALGAQQVMAVGNGANDALMLGAAAIGVAVQGEEGLSTETLWAADVLVGSIGEALDLVINPARLVATLRR